MIICFSAEIAMHALEETEMTLITLENARMHIKALCAPTASLDILELELLTGVLLVQRKQQTHLDSWV